MQSAPSFDGADLLYYVIAEHCLQCERLLSFRAQSRNPAQRKLKIITQIKTAFVDKTGLLPYNFTDNILGVTLWTR